MQFGDIPTDEAEGAILAHSLRLEAKTLKKGTVLGPDDLTVLRDAGYAQVVAARLEPGDVGEDDAANRLARALVGDAVTAGAAFTGRANLYAESAGVVVYDPARLDAFNLIDEAVTLAMVPPYLSVEAGQMIATLKIIAFAVPDDTVLLTEAIARRDTPMVRVALYRPTRVGLVQSRLPGTKESVLDSTLEVTRTRLHPMNSEICHEARCEHATAAIAKAIETTLQNGAQMVLVSGASAVVDRRDVVPAAIVAAGGAVTHFGMPVDPGNLMLMGRIGDATVIGLPGCARSPKLNGFDWVLQRAVARLPIGREEVMRMGPGGLLKDIPSRPMPRTRAKEGKAPVQAHKAPARRPTVAALVLAGGQSRRMGELNKLLADIDGRPMVRHVVDHVLESGADPVVVVTGHEADRVRSALGGCPVTFAENPDFADGLSTSLKTGLAALPAETDGAIVCLADMPKVSAAILDRMIAAFDPVEGRAIIVPTRRGKRGNPVLFARRFFEEMGAVSGDVGARHIIGEHDEVVAEVEVEDEAVLLDVDTPAALAALTGGAEP
ncbi:MAG: molybdopterin-binding/glycosyltransferase family 2 protein [Thalassobaculum sp.]|uniref:molybdopterin-binding/glycosyltransferase family 2 protein n=1 Tax=Thalassobaculum sp. TaxID=2022740 RepID=UPI0032EBF495